MKKLLLFSLLLLTSTLYSQNDDDFNNGIDFRGGGTETFWGIKIDIEKGIYFDMLGDELKIETGIPKTIPTNDNICVVYTAESEKHCLQVIISKETCNDGMSDIQYQYSVKTTITRKEDKEKLEFSGCGNYIFHPLLNDIWALVKFKGKEINEFKNIKSRPYIEIHIKENRIFGNASCNEFYGTVEIIGDKIIFDDHITRTKMNCDEMNLEIEFLQAISGKTLWYKIEKMKLYLMENSEVFMEFNKMD